MTTTATVLELALRSKLAETVPDALERAQPLGQTVARLKSTGAISRNEADLIKEIQYMRNRAVHEGKVPSKAEVEWSLQRANELFSR